MIALVVVGVAGTVVMAMLAPDTLWDELFHDEQVSWLTRGIFSHQPALPMPPTYHTIIAAPAALLGLDSLVAFRAISMLLGLVSIVVFHRLATLQTDRPVERTLQYFFLPLLFPYFFVLYTDVTSILSLLLTAWLLMQRRSLAAGLTAFLALLLRQTNIFWLGFLFLWDVARNRGEETWWKALTDGLRRNAVLVATAPALMVFVLINGRVTLDEPALHPLGLYGGNPWFFFVAAFFALAPLHLANHRKVLDLLRRPAVAGAVVLGFPLYWFTFSAPHPLNTSAGFMRNLLLSAVEDSTGFRIVLFLVIAYAALSLATIRLDHSADYLVYPFTLLALLPSMLVEIRYMLFPLVWIVLTRQRSTDRDERLFLVYGVAMSVMALWAFGWKSLFY